MKESNSTMDIFSDSCNAKTLQGAKRNLKEPTSHTSPLSVNKAAHSGFETQRTRHRKSKTGVSGPIKRTCFHQKNFKEVSNL